MKLIIRVFAIVFVLLISCQLYTGCQFNPEIKYESFIGDVASDGIIPAKEIAVWQGVDTYLENMVDEKISIQGQTYTGKYQDTSIHYYSSVAIDNYLDENMITFGIEHETRKFRYLNRLNQDLFSTEPFLDDVENWQEVAIALAKKIAGEYINVEEYQMKLDDDPWIYEKTIDGNCGQVTFYDIEFCKQVQGYPSSDRISLTISSKGNLVRLSLGDIGVLDNISIQINKEDVNSSINAIVEDVYQQIGYTVLSTEMSQQKICMTPEKELTIVSLVDIEIADEVTTYRTKLAIYTMVG